MPISSKYKIRKTKSTRLVDRKERGYKPPSLWSILVLIVNKINKLWSSMEHSKEKNKESAGSISYKMRLKDTKAQSAIDQMREQLTDYDKNIAICVNDNKKVFDGDFYVVVITKKERLMQNIFRGYYFARLSCPTPDYDQAVYKYMREDDHLEFLWVIPAASIVDYMKNNAKYIPPDQYGLLSYVMKFTEGTLLRLSKELNGEKRDSNIIE